MAACNPRLVYDILVFPRHLGPAIALVQAFPQQSFVLDHCAKPFIKDGILDPWAVDIRTLASFPNVTCKLSGLVTEADWTQWNEAQLLPYLTVVLDAFGPDRCMIGSDWPVCLLASPYDRTMQAVVNVVTARFGADAVAQVLGGTCARVYGV